MPAPNTRPHAVLRGRCETRDLCWRCDLTKTQERDRVPSGRSDPEAIAQTGGRLAVASCCQSSAATGCRRQREFGDGAVGHDSIEHTAFREPDVPIGTDGDVDRRTGLTRDWKLGDLPLHRHAPDAI